MTDTGARAGSMRLSVIVPCHDAAQYLPTTLASAERNAAPDIEWILVDDGSGDDTAEILAAFRPTLGTARVLTHPTAHGLAGARNAGTEVAAGRYLTYLDADDWYAPGYLPRMADAIERLGVDFVRTDHVQSEGRRRTTKVAPEARRWRPLPARDGIDGRGDRESMVDYPYAWSAVYDRRLADAGLLHVDPALKTAEDRLMSWRLHLHADRFAVVGVLGYFYRRAVPGSLTAIGDDRQLHFFDSYDRIGAELDRDTELEAFRAKWVRSYLAVIAHHEVSRRRLHRDVHARFRRRARTTIRSLPEDLVREAVRKMDARRALIVRRLA